MPRPLTQSKILSLKQDDDFIVDVLGLIRQIQMYGRINHDRPKDYKELCETFLNKYEIDF